VGLTDVAGIFSRAFVVGYFVPCFFALNALRIGVDEDALPAVYTDYSDATEIVIAGAVAVLLGLLLSGLHFPVVRLFEGYPLRNWKRLAWLNELLLKRQRSRFRPLYAAAHSPTRSKERSDAIRELDRHWPAEEDELLPTQFGNTLRAFERHPRHRYNLNGIAAYPRIAALLTDAEREIATDARTDVAFFVNSALLAVLVGLYTLVDSVWHGWWDTGYVALALLLPPLVFVAAYRAAVEAGTRWGLAVRTSFDLHRFELYERMGLRRPVDPADEHAIAEGLNRCLVYGFTLPPAIWSGEGTTSQKEEA
jgi:hypothetical protein